MHSSLPIIEQVLSVGAWATAMFADGQSAVKGVKVEPCLCLIVFELEFRYGREQIQV